MRGRLQSSVLKLFHGSRFRWYAPQSPAALAGPRLRIALVSLIPYLGDSVLLFPLMDAIRREHSDAEISLFTSGAGSILKLHPGIDHVYLHQRSTAWWKRSVYGLWLDWHKNYRRLRFDVCVVPRGGVEPFHSAHLAWMLGAAVRVGYSPGLEPERAGADSGADSLFTHSVTVRGGVHEVQRGAEVLALAGVLHRPINISHTVDSLLAVARSEVAKRFMAKWPPLTAPYAIIAPIASIPRKRWSPSGFAELAQTEAIDRGILPVFIGSLTEKALCESIAATLNGPSLVLTGTTFVELAALCLGAIFFIGNESGPAHVAGPLGIPTVAATSFARSGNAWHNGSPQRTHPCGPWVKVVQPAEPLVPCTTECLAAVEHCIGQISTQEMRVALRALIDARQGLIAQASFSNHVDLN
jgi:heptosyltransferase-3